jgi:hypothetical protein
MFCPSHHLWFGPPSKHFVKNTKHEASHYAVFCVNWWIIAFRVILLFWNAIKVSTISCEIFPSARLFQIISMAVSKFLRLCFFNIWENQSFYFKIRWSYFLLVGNIIRKKCEAPRHEGVLWEWRYIYTHSLTSELDAGEWSDLRFCCFTPRERAPGTHWIIGWAGHRAGLDAVSKIKIPNPHRQSKSSHSIV